MEFEVHVHFHLRTCSVKEFIVFNMIFTKAFLLISISVKVHGSVVNTRLNECDQIPQFLSKVLRELNLRETFTHDVALLTFDVRKPFAGECWDGLIRNLPEENLHLISTNIQNLKDHKTRKAAVAILLCDFKNIVS
jgi:hypothetical protein